MSWCGSSIGNYSMYTHDSIYDKVRNPHSKEFFENFKVEVEFVKHIDKRKNEKEKEILYLPLTMFGTMKPINKFYEFELDINMSPILFEELKKRGILLSGTCELAHYCGEDKDGTRVWKSYFLNSPIGDENIKLSTVPNIYTLTFHDDFLWLRRNGLEFNQI